MQTLRIFYFQKQKGKNASPADLAHRGNAQQSEQMHRAILFSLQQSYDSYDKFISQIYLHSMFCR